MLTRHNRTQPARGDSPAHPGRSSLWPLLAVGVGLASLLGTARAAGELLYILQCAGAIGGSDPGRQREAPRL